MTTFNLDPRANRADLQARQAKHQSPADLAAGRARATRPELVGQLLGRAAAGLLATNPAPVISPETEGDQECP